MTCSRSQNEKVTKVTYSDGSEIITNYSDEDFNYKDIIVEKMNYKLIK